MHARRILQITILCAFPIPIAAQALTVCEVLSRLSELNDREIKIRGYWLFSDNGEYLMATGDCGQKVVRDGWIWRNAINVGPDDVHHFVQVGKDLMKLRQAHVFATMTGRLETKDHFEKSRNTGLPSGYGDCVAGLVYTKVEDLEAVDLTQEDVARIDEMSRSPWPIRVKAKKTKH